MGLLHRLLGLPDKGKIREKLNNGAILLDVRTKEEYHYGHVKGSINIPVSELPSKINKLNKENTIIAVCASGARSAQAVRYLKSKGFDSYNGGGWRSFI
ncbi:MAG: rhodanese-like domain-containing protein [Fermentimonas sp.]|nr:rhodanese-like domain-containing protein [Fermentimonas sp.]